MMTQPADSAAQQNIPVQLKHNAGLTNTSK